MSYVKSLIKEFLKYTPQLIFVLIVSFLCSILDPIRKSNAKYFPLVIIGICLLGLLSFSFVVLYSIKVSKNRKNFYCTIIYIFLSCFILTIVFKVIYSISSDCYMNTTGLYSIIFLFSYYVILLVLSFFLFKDGKGIEEVEI